MSSTSHFGGGGKQLNVDRLPQTHIIDVLAKRYAVVERDFLDASVSLETVIAPIQANIVALSRGKGEPLGTGLLIHPRLLLTARHCVEELALGEISVRLDFQKLPDGSMSFGVPVGVQGIVEESAGLDYAILLLKEPVPGFVPLTLDLSGATSGALALLHHPQGGPKKVSVHASVESDYMMLVHAGFQDSEKGSSGGGFAVGPR